MEFGASLELGTWSLVFLFSFPHMLLARREKSAPACAALLHHVGEVILPDHHILLVVLDVRLEGLDALGNVEVFEPRGKDHYLRISLAREHGRCIVHKGSIAIDGISLTIAEVTEASLAVWIIPHTIAVTNLRTKRPGDPVNLEFDLLGKHVEKLLLSRSP